MTNKVIFGKADDLLESTMSMMSEKRIRHLPVLNGEELAGMLSLGDLVKETISYQQRLIAELEQYIRG
jgi:CBS domain-containing protein